MNLFNIREKKIKEQEGDKFGQTLRNFFLLGVPQGLSPPEKLGKLRHTIDLMLYWKKEVKVPKWVLVEKKIDQELHELLNLILK